MEPRNAASEQIRTNYPTFSRLPDLSPEELQAFRDGLTPDSIREDRRRVVSIPKTVGPDELFESVLTYWDLGGGSPVFSIPEVLAVRGNRSVLFRSRVEFQDGLVTESLCALVYSPEMKARHSVMFDADDVEAAKTELDRLYETYEAQSPER